MSASSKKKLRNEQNAASLTERQLSEQKEAKKVKAYTIAFVAVLVVLVAIAIFVGASQVISNSGVREQKTIALTVDDQPINSAEFNYFYVDSVNNFMNQYGSMAPMFGLDVSKPLDEQVVNPETGSTWADDFINSAKDSAASVYALCAAAEAEGYAITEEEAAQIDTMMANLDVYAAMSGMGSPKNYLKAMYGSGASVESYRSYVEKSILADSYQRHHVDSMTYDDAALREAEKENYDEFSSFTYNQYYLPASSFLTGGTTDDEGNTTYSEEEKAASVKAAEEAAKTLASGAYTSTQDFDKAIAALSINAENATAASTANLDTPYTSIMESIATWLAEDTRKVGDMTYVPSTSITTDDEGAETEITNGYYVVYFNSVNDNTYSLANVRHILIGFEGGTADDAGNVVYSDEEKAAAKAKAEELLAQWESGDKTEDSFAALATENTTDPGSKENGGLYEDVYPGQMVPSFNDWCFDEARKTGDTGIVETNYGYHVMFYSGDSETTFRDFMITNKLTSADFQEWFANLVDSAVVTDGDFSMIRTDLVVGAR